MQAPTASVSIDVSSNASAAVIPRMDFLIGCIHSRRYYKIYAPCCNLFFSCIYCHNESSDHTLDRSSINQMVCTTCLMEERTPRVQPLGSQCIDCEASIDRYNCFLCRTVLDDLESDFYPCRPCTIRYNLAAIHLEQKPKSKLEPTHSQMESSNRAKLIVDYMVNNYLSLELTIDTVKMVMHLGFTRADSFMQAPTASVAIDISSNASAAVISHANWPIPLFGCIHSRRNYKIYAPCCNLFFSCIYCHNERRDHSLQRSSIDQMVCTMCLAVEGTPKVQPLASQCMRCELYMPGYNCIDCQTIQDDPEIDFYPCGPCSIHQIHRDRMESSKRASLIVDSMVESHVSLQLTPERVKIVMDKGFTQIQSQVALLKNKFLPQAAIVWLSGDKSSHIFKFPPTHIDYRTDTLSSGIFDTPELVQSVMALNLCSLVLTHRVRHTPQLHYFCQTCDKTVWHGVCEACARICHAGHALSTPRYSDVNDEPFFCNCNVAASCQTLSMKHYRKPEASTQAIADIVLIPGTIEIHPSVFGADRRSVCFVIPTDLLPKDLPIDSSPITPAYLSLCIDHINNHFWPAPKKPVKVQLRATLSDWCRALNINNYLHLVAMLFFVVVVPSRTSKKHITNELKKVLDANEIGKWENMKKDLWMFAYTLHHGTVNQFYAHIDSRGHPRFNNTPGNGVAWTAALVKLYNNTMKLPVPALSMNNASDVESLPDDSSSSIGSSIITVGSAEALKSITVFINSESVKWFLDKSIEENEPGPIKAVHYHNDMPLISSGVSVRDLHLPDGAELKSTSFKCRCGEVSVYSPIPQLQRTRFLLLECSIAMQRQVRSWGVKCEVSRLDPPQNWDLLLFCDEALNRYSQQNSADQPVGWLIVPELCYRSPLLQNLARAASLANWRVLRIPTACHIPWKVAHQFLQVNRSFLMNELYMPVLRYHQFYIRIYQAIYYDELKSDRIKLAIDRLSGTVVAAGIVKCGSSEEDVLLVRIPRPKAVDIDDPMDNRYLPDAELSPNEISNLQVLHHLDIMQLEQLSDHRWVLDNPHLNFVPIRPQLQMYPVPLVPAAIDPWPPSDPSLPLSHYRLYFRCYAGIEVWCRTIWKKYGFFRGEDPSWVRFLNIRKVIQDAGGQVVRQFPVLSRYWSRMSQLYPGIIEVILDDDLIQLDTEKSSVIHYSHLLELMRNQTGQAVSLNAIPVQLSTEREYRYPRLNYCDVWDLERFVDDGEKQQLDLMPPPTVPDITDSRKRRAPVELILNEGSRTTERLSIHLESPEPHESAMSNQKCDNTSSISDSSSSSSSSSAAVFDSTMNIPPSSSSSTYSGSIQALSVSIPGTGSLQNRVTEFPDADQDVPGYFTDFSRNNLPTQNPPLSIQTDSELYGVDLRQALGSPSDFRFNTDHQPLVAEHNYPDLELASDSPNRKQDQFSGTTSTSVIMLPPPLISDSNSLDLLADLDMLI